MLSTVARHGAKIRQHGCEQCRGAYWGDTASSVSVENGPFSDEMLPDRVSGAVHGGHGQPCRATGVLSMRGAQGVLHVLSSLGSFCCQPCCCPWQREQISTIPAGSYTCVSLIRGCTLVSAFCGQLDA